MAEAAAAAGAGAVPPVAEYMPKVTIEEITAQIEELNSDDVVAAEESILQSQLTKELYYARDESHTLEEKKKSLYAELSPNGVGQASQEYIEGGLAWEIEQGETILQLRRTELIPAINRRLFRAHSLALTQAKGGSRKNRRKTRHHKQQKQRKTRRGLKYRR